jgi:aspartyl-tRNA(Asn)/glutamyl-tRNA(Gln) amidotransferase subunit B
VGNWIMGEVSKWLNAVEDNTFEEFSEFVPARNLAALITRIADSTISSSAGKTVFIELTHAPGTMFDSALDYIDSIIDAKGLKQMNDTGALEKIIDDVLAANPKNVDQFRSGNDKALNALVGQIMKGSQGKANPQQVNELLRKKLAS